MKKKKVLVVGGSRGIGAETVREFTTHGAMVAFFYNNSHSESVQLSKETGALNVKCNIASPKSVMAAMNVVKAYFGAPIDVLVCNAGICDSNLVTDIGVERWDEIINVNLNGAYYCIDKVLPGMISQKSGNIVLVSSMWGEVGASCEVAYSASKAGIIGLTKALAKEVGPSGIRVNCVSPGFIDTDMNRNVTPEVRAEYEEETPLCRIGTPQEVAKAIFFLSSEKSSFITGQVIGVNGGLVV